MGMIDLFVAARRVSVPLTLIQTVDQEATQKTLKAAIKEEHPLLRWDAVEGITSLNAAGAEWMAQVDVKSAETVGFVEAMIAAQHLPQFGVLIAHNVHRQLESSEPSTMAAAVQAVANLRGPLKANWRMLAMLAPLGTSAPSELEQDVVVLEHELPGRDELEKVLVDVCAAGAKASKDFQKLEGAELGRAVDAVAGLSAFASEQVASMSITRKGIDIEALWERKRVQIEQTDGLRVHRGAERFADIVGCDNIKARLRQLLGGRKPLGCVVMIDEIDKVLANVESDANGTRMDQFMNLLTEMENNEWEGILLAGLPGGGKSLFAKALGNEAGVPTIMLDMAGTEDKHVGESEKRIRRAMAVIKAVGGGRAFFVTTSNNATVMRPELQRRMTAGFFFFDLLSAAERAAAWTYYSKKYELPAQELPEDDGWTAAEIRNCAREAWNCNVSLIDAARFVLPVARARAKEFDAMRAYAHGKYFDAAKPGTYRYEAAPMREHVRAIALPPEAVAAIGEIVNMKES